MNFALAPLANGEIKAKSFEIQKKNSKLMSMKQKLHAAQATIALVMAESNTMLKPFELSHDEIDFGKVLTKLGEGSFGTVYRAILRGTIDVAVKTMRVAKVVEIELVKFKSELLVSAASLLARRKKTTARLLARGLAD